MLNGYCGNVSLMKTPLKCGISSSRTYADNSMNDSKWLNILPFLSYITTLDERLISTSHIQVVCIIRRKFIPQKVNQINQ